jgi:hypothetical protein
VLVVAWSSVGYKGQILNLHNTLFPKNMQKVYQTLNKTHLSIAPSATSGAGSMNAFVLLKKGDLVFVRHYVPVGAETIHASYGSWIYNYLCNQCLSSLQL